MIGVTKQNTGASLLGLAFDGSKLEMAVAKRSNGSVEIKHSSTVALSLDPLTNEPELVGAEIRKHLDAAEVRERQCVVCVPLNWALTLQVKLPDLPEEDVENFLQLEAERGFPYAPEALMLSRSIVGTAGGERHATLVAVPRDHVERLDAALTAARLRPASFSLGISALQRADAGQADGVAALVPGEKHIGLQITARGGVAALRALEGALEMEGTEKRVQADLIARELRITLGQLPSDVRASVRTMRIFGKSDVAEELAEQLRSRAGLLGMGLDAVREHGGEFGVTLPAHTAVSPALSLAVRQLTGAGTGFEFLPPKISAWQQLTAKYSSRKLVTTGVAVGAVALLAGAAFGWQQYELWHWGSQWDGMKKRVAFVEDMQNQIRKYRPWFDESFRSLSILRKLTEAFPEDGGVSAKTVEIRDKSVVICTGTARNNQALLRTLDQLRAAKEVSDVKVEHIKGGNGGAPLEFTFNFHWANQTGGIR